MDRSSRRGLRVAFAALLALSVVSVGVGFAGSSTETTFESYLDGDGDVARDAQIAPGAGGITVIATDSNSWRGERSEGPRALAELIAFNPNGTVRYYNDSHTRYWDVDPVPGTSATVEYSFADHLDPAECPAPDEWNHSEYAVDERTWAEYYRSHGDVGACTFNGVERVNLTTGEVERVWGHRTPGKEATRYHDADRLNDTHLVVADIFLDRVFVVNTETDRIEWTWNGSEAFSPTAGGPSPADWTHINDVEVLPDGRIMVSVRNMDRVVFLDPGEGMQESWTLGAEDEYRVLYEQHNPDYIPESNGGPAVVVADSENNRVVEYQRVDGEWRRTWLWRDARMQWPRDADRLPNGHTLIADSNANRVFEVDEDGEVVWSVNVGFPYEVERLGTGDESTGGPSARAAGIESHSGTIGDQILIAVKGLIPGRYLNGLMYVTPVWMGLPEVLAIALGVVVVLVWGGVEAGWAVRRRRMATRGESGDGSADED